MIRSERPRSSAMAATACSRRTKNSLWSSSPLLGVKAIRKCARRSDHGPGTPSCSVQFSAETPGSGCLATVARVPPKNVPPANAAPGRRAARVGARHAALQPGLRDGVPAPVRKQADAVGAGGGGVEILQHRLPRKRFKDVLPDHERGFDVQGHLGDDAQCAEAHDGAVEVGRAAPAEVVDGSVRCHDFQRGDGGCQVSVGIPGSVGGGCDGAGHGDVRKGGEVGQRKAVGLQLLREGAVAGPAGYRDGARGGVDADARVQVFQRDQGAGGVGDGVEGVPGAECADLRGAGHHVLDFLESARAVDGSRRVAVIAGPVQFRRGAAGRCGADRVAVQSGQFAGLSAHRIPFAPDQRPRRYVIANNSGERVRPVSMAIHRSDVGWDPVSEFGATPGGLRSAVALGSFAAAAG